MGTHNSVAYVFGTAQHASGLNMVGLSIHRQLGSDSPGCFFQTYFRKGSMAVPKRLFAFQSKLGIITLGNLLNYSVCFLICKMGM